MICYYQFHEGIEWRLIDVDSLTITKRGYAMTYDQAEHDAHHALSPASKPRSLWWDDVEPIPVEPDDEVLVLRHGRPTERARVRTVRPGEEVEIVRWGRVMRGRLD